MWNLKNPGKVRKVQISTITESNLNPETGLTGTQRLKITETAWQSWGGETDTGLRMVSAGAKDTVDINTRVLGMVPEKHKADRRRSTVNDRTAEMRILEGIGLNRPH